MSGSPQGTIDTPYYKIDLYHCFRRSVPAGSDYFSEKSKAFRELFLLNKDRVDGILAGIKQAGVAIEAFCEDAYRCGDVLTLSSETACGEAYDNMHAIHVRVSLIVNGQVSDELQSTMIAELFQVFNPTA